MCMLIILLFVTAAFFFVLFSLGIWISGYVKSMWLVSLVGSSVVVVIAFSNSVGQNLFRYLMWATERLDHVLHQFP